MVTETTGRGHAIAVCEHEQIVSLDQGCKSGVAVPGRSRAISSHGVGGDAGKPMNREMTYSSRQRDGTVGFISGGDICQGLEKIEGGLYNRRVIISTFKSPLASQFWLRVSPGGPLFGPRRLRTVLSGRSAYRTSVQQRQGCLEQRKLRSEHQCMRCVQRPVRTCTLFPLSKGRVATRDWTPRRTMAAFDRSISIQ